MWVMGRRVIGLMSAAVAAAALVGCGSSPERDEVGADTTTAATTSDTVDDAITAATTSDVVDDAPSRSNGPWAWTGTLIQERGEVPRACFGEIQMSDPPSCPTGMPILDFDLSATAWAEHYDEKTVAFASIVGHPTVDGFVLDGAISKASGSVDQLECDVIGTGATNGGTMNPQPAFDLLESDAARAAGVWFAYGGIAGNVRMDASVLIVDDSVIDWFETQPEFEGFELTVCPLLREA